MSSNCPSSHLFCSNNTYKIVLSMEDTTDMPFLNDNDSKSDTELSDLEKKKKLASLSKQPKNKANNQEPSNYTDIDQERLKASKRRSTRHKGPYILGKTIGEGAFAKVKVATHIHTGEKVAIKILDKTKMLEGDADIERVQKEISILKKLRHKNIIQLYEVMESRNNLYIVMEYCEGKELFDHIVTQRRLDEAEACKYFQEIVDGVDYLHSQCIVHRDLKPENLLLDYKNSIKISDFGLSSVYEKNGLLSTPCGTPSYAPPEMLKGESYSGLYSDVWSCGIILYAMLCGFLPFSESKEEIICQKILDREYEMPEHLSPLAVDLLNNILKVDIHERFDLEQIKAHPWFQLVRLTLRPGIILGSDPIPIDEDILNQVEEFGFNKEICKKNLDNNKYDSITSVYYLCLRKFIKAGGKSISDMESEKYLRFIRGSFYHEKARSSSKDLNKQVRAHTESSCSAKEKKSYAINAIQNIVKKRTEVSNTISKEKQIAPVKNIRLNSPNIINTVQSNDKTKHLKLKLKEYSASLVNNKAEAVTSGNKNSFLTGGNKIRSVNLVESRKAKPTTNSKIINVNNINFIYNSNPVRSPTNSNSNNKPAINQDEKKPTIFKENKTRSNSGMTKPEATSKLIVKHSDSTNNVSELNEPIVTNNNEDALEEELNRLNKTGANVLELIANKLLKSTNFNISGKKETRTIATNSLGKSVNYSSNHNRTASFKDNPEKKLTKSVKINLKRVKDQTGDKKIGYVIGLLNEKFKSFYESNQSKMDTVELVKDDLTLGDEEEAQNINTETLSRTKPKVSPRQIKIQKKNYTNEESESHVKTNRIFLDISTNYDPDLDSRNESSVEKSHFRSNMRHLSFSPEFKSNSGSANISDKICFTSKSINYSKNTSTQNPLNNNKQSYINKLKDNIGVISEHDELNVNKAKKTPNYVSVNKTGKVGGVTKLYSGDKKKLLFLNELNDLRSQSALNSMISPVKIMNKNFFTSKAGTKSNKIKPKVFSKGAIQKVKEGDARYKSDKSMPRLDNFISNPVIAQIKNHRKTSSAIQIKSNIFKEKDVNQLHVIHQRNKSGLLLESHPTVKTIEEDIPIINSIPSILELVNQNEDNLLVNSRMPTDVAIPSKKIETITSGNINIPNLLLNLQNFSSEPAYNTERPTNKENKILEDVRNLISNRSERRASNIFLLKDKDSEKLKTYLGPVDLNCLTSSSPSDVIQSISDYFSKKRVSFVQTNPYKLRCSKNGISFDLEVFKLDLDLNYIKFKLNQGGDYANYRKLVQNILFNLNI